MDWPDKLGVEAHGIVSLSIHNCPIHPVSPYVSSVPSFFFLIIILVFLLPFKLDHRPKISTSRKREHEEAE
jgi:hypothetical protein